MKKLLSIFLFQAILLCITGFAYADNIYEKDPDNYYRYPLVFGKPDAPKTIIIYCDPSTELGKDSFEVIMAVNKLQLIDDFKDKYKVILSGDSPDKLVKKLLITIAIVTKKLSIEMAENVFLTATSFRTSDKTFQDLHLGSPDSKKVTKEIMKELENPKYEKLFNEGSKAIMEKYNIAPYDYPPVNPKDPEHVLRITGVSPTIIIDGHVYDRGVNGQTFVEGEGFNILNLNPTALSSFIRRVAVKYPPYNDIP